MSNLSNSLVYSFQRMWDEIIYFLPTILVAVVILIAGLILASIVGKLITKITAKLYVDKILTAKIKRKLKEMKVDLTISGVFGWMVKWFIIVGTLLSVSDILNLKAISNFLLSVLLYIPNVIVATVIVVIGLVVGKFISELIEKAVSGSNVVSQKTPIIIRNIVKWLIVLFSIMAGLIQLKIAPQLIQTLFAGLVFGVSLAGGIAFGFGGKKKAEELLEELFSGGE